MYVEKNVYLCRYVDNLAINLANTCTFWTGLPIRLLTKRFFSDVRLWKAAVCSVLFIPLNMGPQHRVLKDCESITKKQQINSKLMIMYTLQSDSQGDEWINKWINRQIFAQYSGISSLSLCELVLMYDTKK
jgi:hypothetical protein